MVDLSDITDYLEENSKKILFIGLCYLAFIDPGAYYFMKNPPLAWIKDSCSVAMRHARNLKRFFYENMEQQAPQYEPPLPQRNRAPGSSIPDNKAPNNAPGNGASNNNAPNNAPIVDLDRI